MLQELGADEVIDYYTHKFEDVLKGRPVDVVIDSIGGVLPSSFWCMTVPGTCSINHILSGRRCDGSPLHAEGVGDRSYKVLKRRGHYQRISNETLSPTRVAIGCALLLQARAPPAAAGMSAALHLHEDTKELHGPSDVNRTRCLPAGGPGACCGWDQPTA